MNSSPPPPLVDQIERTGNPFVLVGMAVAAAAAILAVWLAPNGAGLQVVAAMIVVLASFGALGLLLLSFGALQFPARGSRFDSTKAVVDSNPDGIVDTDRQYRIVYANEADRTLSCARSGADLKPVERAFAGPPDISESIYRLSQASKAGKSASEDLRLAPSLNGESEVAWYRIRVRP